MNNAPNKGQGGGECEKTGKRVQVLCVCHANGKDGQKGQKQKRRWGVRDNWESSASIVCVCHTNRGQKGQKQTND